MAQKKKKWVLLKSTTTIPAEIAGGKKDKLISKGERENLPVGYADFLISSGLAEDCDAPKKTAPKPPQAQSAQKNDADAQQKLESAQAVVDGITAKMEAMSEGDAGWDELSQQLDEACTALAELQPPA